MPHRPTPVTHLLLGLLFIAIAAETSHGAITVSVPKSDIELRFGDLRQAIGVAGALSAGTDDAVYVELDPGSYWVDPIATTESTCGNCLDPKTTVEHSLGLLVTGKNLHLRGATDHRSILHTHAGYGVLFRDCIDCSISGLVVTDGVRDRDGNATDAAIVIHRSSVTVSDNWILDNIGDPEIIQEKIVGIIGIAGREGSEIRIERNRIHRNSWDGIALYRDAGATIVDNDIDGVDLALGRTAGGGRGVGIGMTWNARATVRGNRVSRYWKGIGAFVDAHAVVEDNVVEGIATWGLTLWDAGKGTPFGAFRANVVDSTGACGASIVRSAPGSDPGYLIGNAFFRTGQNPKYDSGEPYCYQEAIAIHAAPDPFRIEGNLFAHNREPFGRAGSRDMEPDQIDRALQPLLARLSMYRSTRESRFYESASRALGSRGSVKRSTAGPEWGRR